MTKTDKQFQIIYQQAQKSPDILGLFLSGSRGKGFQSKQSDYDIRIITKNTANLETIKSHYSTFEHSQRIEFNFSTLESFEAYAELGSAFDWDRYSFAHVEALIDKTGQIQPLILQKGNLPKQFQDERIRSALDGFINAVYRSFKCIRNHNVLGARLEAASGLSYFLEVIFALEGRHAPYLGYLENELRVYPLKDLEISVDDLLDLFQAILDTANNRAQRTLLGLLESPCKDLNMTGVFEAWGDAYPWIMAFRENT